MLSEHKRVKTGHLPGDISQDNLIRMRESREPFYIFPWQYMTRKGISTFRRDMKRKGRAVQRRRDKETIERSINES